MIDRYALFDLVGILGVDGELERDDKKGAFLSEWHARDFSVVDEFVWGEVAEPMATVPSVNAEVGEIFANNDGLEVFWKVRCIHLSDRANDVDFNLEKLGESSDFSNYECEYSCVDLTTFEGIKEVLEKLFNGLMGFVNDGSGVD